MKDCSNNRVLMINHLGEYESEIERVMTIVRMILIYMSMNLKIWMVDNKTLLGHYSDKVSLCKNRVKYSNYQTIQLISSQGKVRVGSARRYKYHAINKLCQQKVTIKGVLGFSF